MRVGVILLPEHRASEMAARWRRLDAWGFDSAWTYDHLAWRSLADGPWFATVPTLAAAALVTSRIRLGTFVASPNFRHPVPFAKELMTLDDLSGGRLTLGVGAGGLGFDADVLGHARLSAADRVERFAEFVDLLDRLLTSPCTT
ncbi:MAG: LLM class flavin-dependent oxidoreductase, partial [Nocardioides sp.]